jgi:hypothetical protein
MIEKPDPNKEPDDYFKDDNEPVGAVVTVERETPRGRLASLYFNKLLFQYFQELANGSTGWGVDFIAWLHISKGWQKVKGKMRDYERIGYEE